MPKVSTFRKNRYTAQLWNFNQVTDGGGSNSKVFFYLRDIEFDLSQGMFGKITVFLPDEAGDAMVGAQLRQLKDQAGNEIVPGGVWTLTGLVPVLTIFGTREGYRADGGLTFLTAAS